MNYSDLIVTLIQLAIFSVFVTSLIEVIKSISAIGFFNMIKEFFATLMSNKPMSSESFPVLNYVISLLFCWAFNTTIMAHILSNYGGFQSTLSHSQQLFSKWLDYLSTAAVIYKGSDIMFKKFINVIEESKDLKSAIESTEPPVSK